MYEIKDVEHDYDAGLGLDIIAKKWLYSQKIDLDRRIGIKKAHTEICEIIYNHVPKRKKKGG